MGTLIRFELRKILGNRAGMVACALALALMAGIAVLNLATFSSSEYSTGKRVEGFEAQQAFHDWKNAHAGILDDERIAQDVSAFEQAKRALDENEDLEHMSGADVIAAYGLDYYHQTYSLVTDGYYSKLTNALYATIPPATSLKEGTAARLELNLDENYGAQFSYTQAEKEYWRAKAAQVEWPIEYGSALAWENIFHYLSFLALVIVALCIALSGVFAGEYQARTASVVLPTARGKRALPAAKVVAAFAFASMYWWVSVAVLVGINVAVCGAQGWNLPLQIEDFANPYALSMGGVVLATALLGWVLALGMAAFTLFLSARLRSTMPVAVIPMAVVFLGLFAMFINPLVKIAMLTPLSGMNYAFTRLASYAAGPVVLDLPTMLVLLYGVALVVLTPLAVRAFRRHQVA